ncbi:MAG: hypothetical protein PHR77_17100 [Kiritimatiellae bacterium]|nr:hypothetical protein [Kiritimatiellia bacterium]
MPFRDGDANRGADWDACNPDIADGGMKCENRNTSSWYGYKASQAVLYMHTRRLR